MITATCSSQKQDAIRLKAHGETFSLRCMNLLDGGFCALTWDGVGGKKECPIAALENVIGDLSSSIRKQSA